MSPTVHTVLSDLAWSDAEALRLAHDLGDDALNRREGAAWSVGQCLSHLATGNRVYAEAIAAAVRSASAGRIGDADAEIRPGLFERWFIALLDGPPKVKLKNPKKSTPSARVAGPDVLRDFVAAHDQLRATILECRERNLDPNRVRFRNPFVGVFRFTIGTGFLVVTGHNRRHLWQAARAREKL